MTLTQLVYLRKLEFLSNGDKIWQPTTILGSFHLQLLICAPEGLAEVRTGHWLGFYLKTVREAILEFNHYTISIFQFGLILIFQKNVELKNNVQE